MALNLSLRCCSSGEAGYNRSTTSLSALFRNSDYGYVNDENIQVSTSFWSNQPILKTTFSPGELSAEKFYSAVPWTEAFNRAYLEQGITSGIPLLRSQSLTIWA